MGTISKVSGAAPYTYFYVDDPGDQPTQSRAAQLIV